MFLYHSSAAQLKAWVAKCTDLYETGHFTVVCSVSWPFDRCVAGDELSIVLLFLFLSLFFYLFFFFYAKKPCVGRVLFLAVLLVRRSFHCMLTETRCGK